eukprot:GHVH01012352.1.p1 GENE.GHVH01012352.1~~GHVH01012352.1.p1  ORF type:complete len:100 (+),score=8.34 GHVH01012352.1:1-300(+)
MVRKDHMAMFLMLSSISSMVRKDHMAMFLMLSSISSMVRKDHMAMFLMLSSISSMVRKDHMALSEQWHLTDSAREEVPSRRFSCKPLRWDDTVHIQHTP